MIQKIVGVLGVASAGMAQTAQLQVVQPPAGYTGISAGVISGDGQVAFGTLAALQQPATPLFRWSDAAGMQIIGLPQGVQAAQPMGASDDGSMLVGRFYAAFWNGFRWTQNIGFGVLPFSAGAGAAHGVSGNSVWVAGSHDLSLGFRWSEGTGALSIPSPQSGIESCFLRGISTDGAVIAGYCLPPLSSSAIGFRWTASTATVPLSSPGWFNIRPWDISANGNVLVGSASIGAVGSAIRWTARHGVHQIGGLLALATTADGWQTVSGDGQGSAVLWDPVHGTRDIRQLLASLGAPGLESWLDVEAVDISDDGTRILGGGIPAAGQGQHMWIATIPPFCYANCDGSTTAPALNVGDFTCFLQKFAANDIYGNCNNDSAMDVSDFTCFLQKFVAGCP
jgi:uncharacterized membrane protein